MCPLNKFILIGLGVFSAAFCALGSNPVVILPNQFIRSKVVVENSPQYQDLLGKNKQLVRQLQSQENAWQQYSQKVTDQQKIDYENTNKLLNDFNSLKLADSKKDAVIIKKDLRILQLSVLLGILIAGIILYFVAKYVLVAYFPFLKLIP